MFERLTNRRRGALADHRIREHRHCVGRHLRHPTGCGTTSESR